MVGWGGGRKLALLPPCLRPNGTVFRAATLTMPLMLWVALALAGCCESLFTVSRGSLLRNLVAGTQRGRVMSMLGGTNRMTRTLAPLLGCGGLAYLAISTFPQKPQWPLVILSDESLNGSGPAITLRSFRILKCGDC